MDQHKDVVPTLLVNSPAIWTSAPNQAGAHLHKVREGTVQAIERKVTQHTSLALPGVNPEYRNSLASSPLLLDLLFFSLLFG